MGSFFKGLLFAFLTTIIGLIVLFTLLGVSSIGFDVDIILNLLIFIPIYVFFTWLFSLPLGGLSHANPAVYFGVCLVYSIIILVLGLKGNLSISGTDDEATLVLSSISFHATFFFLVIPKIDSSSQDYIVTKTIYYDGYEVDRRQYIETEYTSGSLVKLITVAILGSIAGYFAFSGTPSILWIIFAVEGGFSLFKFLQSLFAMRE